MLRVVANLLVVLLVISVCLAVGILGMFTIKAFTMAGAPWLGVVVTLSLAVSVGVHLGNLL